MIPILNGDLDIVVVNGHVADNRIYGGDYHQRPQIFENTGDTRFRELTAAAAGDYFGREFLGRGLARIDWDRDGRMDFAVPNMLSQASLVTNVSEKYGHYFSLLLRATLSARDAVGTVVELRQEIESGRNNWRQVMVTWRLMNACFNLAWAPLTAYRPCALRGRRELSNHSRRC